MKNLITCLAAAALIFNTAIAAAKTDSIKKEAVPASSFSLSTPSYLVAENNQLQAQYATLQNKQEELLSTLQYNQLMANLTYTLRENEWSQQAEEMKSTMAYQQMMAGMISQIKADKQDEETEEAKAELAYSKMMSGLLASFGR